MRSLSFEGSLPGSILKDFLNRRSKDNLDILDVSTERAVDNFLCDLQERLCLLNATSGVYKKDEEREKKDS